jgi:hypothetical protein
MDNADNNRSKRGSGVKINDNIVEVYVSTFLLLFLFFGQRAEGQGCGDLPVQACHQQVLCEIHPAAGRGAQE